MKDFDSLKYLVNEFPGDDSWKDYFVLFANEQDIIASEMRDEHNIPEDIFAVLLSRFGSHAFEWYDSPIKGLQGRSPREIVESMPNGDKALRTFIMRMPV